MERPEPGGPHAIPRRHAPIEQLVRQGSFRGFPALSQKNSPFKRQLSLRLNDLPSTLQRKTADFQAKNAGESRAKDVRAATVHAHWDSCTCCRNCVKIGRTDNRGKHVCWTFFFMTFLICYSSVKSFRVANN